MYCAEIDSLAEMIEDTWFGDVIILEDIPEDCPLAPYAIFDDNPQIKKWKKVCEL